ncbi:zinc finger BED domain-containing protein RICESLEEPER 1-like [Tasmannia lanceolata]|uniref:zinc finger BED domain-containing protein RICESLEEPER 1-like n=1 Tax=Tasmannia lanceolata TaxID=3420 RepID=UPI004064B415
MSQEGEAPNVISSEQSSNPTNTNQTFGTVQKRKTMKSRSNVWDHFTKFVNEVGEHKASCMYCEREFCCDPKKNGTSSLKNHTTACKKFPGNMNTSQSQLNYQPIKGQEGDGSGTLSIWKFDQEAIRNALTRMVIVDELPFKSVEKEGFRHFVSIACPRFHIPSRSTVSKDCYQFFQEERSKLKKLFKNSCQRICLTTDTWSSLQRVNYMCLTAHYVDSDWKLHKKILNFCPISSHKGEALGKAVEKCLLDWGIDKVFTVTVDNASSNDVAVGYLKRRLVNWGSSILQGNFLHVRCVAHIINLVVCEGLKEVEIAVDRVRTAVRYVRSSPARLKLFKECIENERIQSKSLLCLDVSTRWNSTYLMLKAAEKFEKAFDKFEVEDPFYSSELDSGDVDGIRKPDHEDWEKVRRMATLLQNFYELTVRVSGSLYVTSNTLFPEIVEVECLLQEWLESDDFHLVMMAKRMKDKYDKYWGNIEKVNKLIYIAVILDPRHKLAFVKFALISMYGEGKGNDLAENVFHATVELFNEFNYKSTVNTPQENQVNLGQLTSRELSEEPRQEEDDEGKV